MRKRRIFIGSVLLVVVSVLLYALFKKVSSSDEEAPIIVKNGSMDVVAGDDPGHNKHWKWVDVGGSNDKLFSHDPNQPHSNKNPGPLFVYVIGNPTGGCTALTSGEAVTVTYNDGFSIKFSRVQHGSSNNYFTHVEGSANQLKPVSAAPVPTLRHDATGYIDSVIVGSASPCTFANAAALSLICISPDDPSRACEQ